MHTLFISDLHLDPNHPKITNTFFYFLEHIAVNADALYILGDFFEVYVGDDEKNTFKQSLINALSRLKESGVSIFLMAGNRDFLIGQDFTTQAGIVLLPDPTVITLAHQKIVLMHGDNLCTDDKSYQRFRKLVRSTIFQKLFLLLPLSFRQKLANKMRQKSRDYSAHKPISIMDVSEKTVAEVIKKYNADKLIHGHTHKPQVGAERIVLDAWHEQGNYFSIDENGKMEMINIPH